MDSQCERLAIPKVVVNDMCKFWGLWKFIFVRKNSVPSAIKAEFVISGSSHRLPRYVVEGIKNSSLLFLKHCYRNRVMRCLCVVFNLSSKVCSGRVHIGLCLFIGKRFRSVFAVHISQTSSSCVVPSLCVWCHDSHFCVPPLFLRKYYENFKCITEVEIGTVKWAPRYWTLLFSNYQPMAKLDSSVPHLYSPALLYWIILKHI